MKHKYVIRYHDLLQAASSGATVDVLIKELLSWGAKATDIRVTLEWEESEANEVEELPNIMDVEECGRF